MPEVSTPPPTEPKCQLILTRTEVESLLAGLDFARRYLGQRPSLANVDSQYRRKPDEYQARLDPIESCLSGWQDREAPF